MHLSKYYFEYDYSEYDYCTDDDHKILDSLIIVHDKSVLVYINLYSFIHRTFQCLLNQNF